MSQDLQDRRSKQDLARDPELEPCETCGGVGRFESTLTQSLSYHACGDCDGEGYVRKEEDEDA